MKKHINIDLLSMNLKYKMASCKNNSNYSGITHHGVKIVCKSVLNNMQKYSVDFINNWLMHLKKQCYGKHIQYAICIY